MTPPNLADPTVEPTDEELQALAHRAFAHVPGANREALERLRREIEQARAEVRQRLGHRRP